MSITEIQFQASAVEDAPVQAIQGRSQWQLTWRRLRNDKVAVGSIIVIIATDAPLSDRNLRRLARRAFIGVGNTGSSMSNGSGDYALAFATAEAVRRTPDRRSGATIIEDLPNDKISPLFQAVAEATEEAVYNAMLQATSTTGVDDHRLEALPLDRLKEILARHGIGTPTK